MPACPRVSRPQSASAVQRGDVTIDGDGDAVYGPVGSGLGGSSVHTVVPGDTTTFQVVIENLSGTDAFDVDWNTPGGWEVTFDGRAAPVNGSPPALMRCASLFRPGPMEDVRRDRRRAQVGQAVFHGQRDGTCRRRAARGRGGVIDGTAPAYSAIRAPARAESPPKPLRPRPL